MTAEEHAPAVDQPTRRDRFTVLSFLTATVASIALLLVYVTGGDPQLEGILLALALGGIGVGLVVWSHELTGSAPVIEDRAPIASDEEPRENFITTLERGEESSRVDG